ncbi:hypothetical protein Gotur_027093 [Gossypium turneri]
MLVKQSLIFLTVLIRGLHRFR